MPFKSEAQKSFMYKNKPEIAKRWEQEAKWDRIPEKLPQRVIKTKKR
jgi:hypothetical protein